MAPHALRPDAPTQAGETTNDRFELSELESDRQDPYNLIRQEPDVAEEKIGSPMFFNIDLTERPDILQVEASAIVAQVLQHLLSNHGERKLCQDGLVRVVTNPATSIPTVTMSGMAPGHQRIELFCLVCACGFS